MHNIPEGLRKAVIQEAIQGIKRAYVQLKHRQAPTIPKDMLTLFIRICLWFEDVRQIADQLQPVRWLLTDYLQKAPNFRQQQKMKQHSRTNLALAIILDYSRNSSAISYYAQAHSLERENPQILLLFSWFLFKTERVQSAIRCIKRINIQKMIDKAHRQNLTLIFRKRVVRFDIRQINQNSSYASEVQRANFIVSIHQCAAIFYQTIIEEQPTDYQKYIDLIKIFMSLNQKDECMELLEVMSKADLKDQYLLRQMGSFYSYFGKNEESIPFKKKALEISPKDELIHSSLIYSLIRMNQFAQAKRYTKKLLKINKYNADAYLNMGQILGSEGREGEAIEYYKASARFQKDQKRLFATYFECGQALLRQRRVFEAIEWLIASIRIRPDIYAYNMLANCFMIVGSKLSEISCYEQAILLNYASLLPFIRLSNLSQQNSTFRAEINAFMTAISERHPSDLHVQFNVALYYHLSRQSHSRFHELIVRCLKQNSSQQSQNAWEKTLFAAIDEYKRFTDYFLKENPMFTMVIGIVLRAKEKYEQSRESFLVLASKYTHSQQLFSSESFEKIYYGLMHKMKDCSLYLEWTAIEILQQSPKEGLKCYFKALNYRKGDYGGFRHAFRRKMEEQIENGVQFIKETVNKPISMRLKEIRIPTLKNKIFALQDFESTMRSLGEQINNMKKFAQNNSPKVFEFNCKRYFSAEQQTAEIGKPFYSAVIGIELNNFSFQRSSYYHQLRRLIDRSQHRIMGSLKTFLYLRRDENSRKMCLQIALQKMEEYYAEQFAANQTVKMVFNGLHPFIPTDHISHQIFAAVLLRFKNDPYHDYSCLEEGLKEIFSNKIPSDDIIEQSEMLSFTPFEDTEKEEAENIIFLREDTQSHFDASDKQSQFFTQKDVLRPRRFSYSDIKQYTTQEHERFIQQIQYITEQKQEKVMKVIAVPPKQEYVTEYSSKKQRYAQDANSFEQSEQSDLQFDPLQLKMPKNDNSCYLDDSQLFEGIQSEYSNFSSPSSTYSIGREQKYLYPIEYSPYRTQFLTRRLYTKLNKLLYLNTYYLIKYLQKNNSSLNYIAKHHIQKDLTLEQLQKGFKVFVERGQTVARGYLNKTLQDQSQDYLINLGPEAVLRWISDIALSIAELEQLGIYHADFAFRNTIRVVREYNPQGTFKIIDFDKAFKVFETAPNDKVFTFTEKILDYWLMFLFDKEHPRQPSSHISLQSQKSASENSQRAGTIYNEDDLISYIFAGADQSLIERLKQIKSRGDFDSKRLPQLLKHLQRHMKKSHLATFTGMVQKLIKKNALKQKVYGQTVMQIKDIILELQIHADYKEFANKISSIRKKIFTFQQPIFNNDDREELQQSIQGRYGKLWPYEDDLSEINTFRYFRLVFSIQDIKFADGRLYQGFKNLLFQNTYHIIRYLSKKSDRQHIAKHQLSHTNISSATEFSVDVERGDEVYCPFMTQSLQEKTLQWIWFLGKEYVIKWIKNIAIGIAELEQLGIYHADLGLRNTIRVTCMQRSVFKIIDFDNAFKVIKTEEKDGAFECTQSLINFWLKSYYSRNQMRPPIGQDQFIYYFSEDAQSSSMSFNIYQETDIIYYIFKDADERLTQQLLHIKHDSPFSSKRIDKCLQMLRNHMKISHRKQFASLVRELLLGGPERLMSQSQKSPIDQGVAFKIMAELKDGSNIDFRHFARRVEEISGLRRQDNHYEED